MVEERMTVGVAMSGGVDSSVAAAYLLEQGHQVFGLTAVMTHEYSRCCSDEDIETARQVSRDLGIEHHIVDVRPEFKSAVIDHFMQEYLRGRTPSPCVICNPVIKFGSLLRAAEKLGAHKLATGHYVSVESRDGRPHLMRGKDRSKDQSYFLARLSPAQLDPVMFPLGGMDKTETVKYAEIHNLSCRASRESQDICFVTGGTHGEWIDLRSFETPGEGDIVDVAGNVLGRHLGVHHYTIGQRKGLGIAVGKPVYVIALDAKDNRVVVGERDEAMSDYLVADDVTWISGEPPSFPARLTVQVRYKHEPAFCTLSDLGGRQIGCQFDEPQFGIAPGQLAAVYDEDEVLGGGWIAR